ncbi:MAG: pirin family protein [Dehalococcoidia bacterium]|nr:pirin family protein [Dehalococcoidia bacterium]
MIEVRRDHEIYHKEGGWFSARWHFSFDEYHDPDNMGFGTMRVFNDDRLIPGAVWPLHPHRDVEGLTYVVEGTFKHADSLGNDGVIPAGSVQRMTLGAGAYHSEQNASQTEPMRFIQVWIMPRQRGLPPSVEQRVFTREDRTDRLLRVIGPDGADGSVLVHQDAAMYVSRLEAGGTVEHEFRDGFGGYPYVIEGGIELNGERLATGDAARVRGEPAIRITARETSELLLMEVQL